jgi:hypothetical protein
MKYLFIFITLSLSVTFISAQTVNILDYGVEPNSFLDATEGVKQAIAACKSQGAGQLTFPKGRYDFRPEKAEKRDYFISNTSSENECPVKTKNIGLLFENIKNLTIEGNGSVFIFHGKMITYAFDNCENIRLQNVSMDFQRPSMSEMTFREIHPDYLIADIHPDSWFDIVDGKLKFYGEGWTMERYHSLLTDTTEGISVYCSFQPILESKATALSPLTVKLEGDFSHSNYKAGHILSIRDPYRDHVGAFIYLSRNIYLENVTMHYMHGLGIVSQFSEDLTYQNIKIIPSRKRSVAAFADGMQFSGCKGHILIENCHFKGLHDDPINAHGTYLQIRKIHSPTSLTVRFMHHQTYGFPAFYENDTVAFVTASSMQQKGITTIKRTDLVSEREIKVELDNPLPKSIRIGDVLENLTWTPVLTVRNNRFECTSTRGLLVTTPRRVCIEGNTFFRTAMYGVLIAADVNNWFESGSVYDITIRKNIFEDCAHNLKDNHYAISIEPEIRKITAGHWAHRNIRIEHNTFHINSGQIVRARSVDGLTIKENKILSSSFNTPVNEDNKDHASFRLENCTHVIIKDNDAGLYPLPISVNYSDMKKRDIKTDIKNGL